MPTPERASLLAGAAVDEGRAARRREVHELRARLRPLGVTRRIQSCGMHSLTETPELVIRDYVAERRAWWSGVMTCGRQFACPVCAARKAAKRKEEIRRLRGDTNGRWQMVTLTLQHNNSQALRALLDVLLKGLRTIRTRRAVRTIFERRVSASIRAVEVTWGKNGWHPHIHLVLRTSHWTDDERATLLREWLSVVDGNPSVAVKWSEPFAGSDIERACYLSKLGAELAGIAKEPASGHYSAWQVARRALTEPRFARLWTEYQEALRGRRILEFDERAKAMVAPESDAEEFLREWRVTLSREEYGALARFELREPAILWFVVEAAVHGGLDPPRAVADTVADVLRWGRTADALPLRRARPGSLAMVCSFEQSAA